jgi:SnoaL-like polyketide cyclase
MYRAAFPDVRMTVDDMIASGDKVVLRWRSEGTHRGELAGLAPWVSPASSAPRPRRAASTRKSAWVFSESWLAGCAGRTRSRTPRTSARQAVAGAVHSPAPVSRTSAGSLVSNPASPALLSLGSARRSSGPLGETRLRIWRRRSPIEPSATAGSQGRPTCVIFRRGATRDRGGALSLAAPLG